MNQIERISHMERALNESAEALAALEKALDQYEAVLPRLKELLAYYQSPLWLQDFDDDRAGRIPKDLPRGVLTEDAVYDLLTDYDRLTKRIQALTGAGKQIL